MEGTIILAVGEESVGERVPPATAYLVGGIAGGAALGAVVGFGSSLLQLPQVVTGTLLALLIVGAGLEGRWLKWRPTPRRARRQVTPSHTLRHSRPTAAAFWGVELGVGLLTWISSWSYWAAVATVAFLGSPTAGLMIGGAFGLARGLQPLTAAVSSYRLRQGARRLERAALSPTTSSIIASACVLAIGASQLAGIR